MSLIGCSVIHKRFGTGEIVDATSDRVLVNFNGVTKPFVYPSSFEQGFLALVDESVSDQLVSDIQRKKETEEEAKRERLEKEEAERVKKEYAQRQQRMKGGVSVPIFSSVSKFCSDYREAVNKEIAYQKTAIRKKLRLTDGKFVQLRGTKYIYSFESGTELHYPDGTQIKLIIPPNYPYATILNCDGFTVLIASSVSLGRDVPSVEFTADATQLLEALNERLAEIALNPSAIAKQLILSGRKQICNQPFSATGQDKAVAMSLRQPITFIWGPPGTGKTETLAKIALAHMRRGHRVLMLSFSNVAVDGATLRVHAKDNHLHEGTIVRYGYPRMKELLNHEYLTSYRLALRNHPSLLKERTRLENERMAVSKHGGIYVEISRRLTGIQNQLIEEEKESVKRASFVATTVSKAIFDKEIYTQAFDVVIFDEASMAYIPQIVFSASLAKRSFVCMGDFSQLPPILENEDKTSILIPDIFQYTGINEAVESNKQHNWLCMLDTQFRMHPEISRFASNYMYCGSLKTDRSVKEKVSKITKQGPFEGLPIVLADLSGAMTVCKSLKDGSRINPLSAFASFSIAMKANENFEVGVISPYNAQARLLHALARDFAAFTGSEKLISCATVHQFQGSEKDIIVFDSVDCYRMPYPGMMLKSTSNNYANRLFNVAMTRAKGKFIAVGNYDYLGKRLPKLLMLRRLIQQYEGKPEFLEFQQIVSAIAENNNRFMKWYENQAKGTNAFISDIQNAQQSITIDVPAGVQRGHLVGSVVQALTKRADKIEITIRSDAPETIPKPLARFVRKDDYVLNPIAWIDKTITWFGEPLSAADFIVGDERVPTKYRPIIRIRGQHTAAVLRGFLR
jgi:hypothetical protein